MFRFVLCLVFIILRAEASVPETDPVEITFEIQWKTLRNGRAIICDHKDIDKVQHTYTVREREEFKIITKYNAFINHVICHNYNNNSDVYLYAKDILRNVTTFKAEKRMGGQWNCTILAHRDNPINPPVQYEQATYSAAYCFMTVHVRQTAPAQTILVNNMVLQVHRTDLSEKNVDFTSEYQYVDGDVVNVTCINFLNQAPLTMEYMMAGTKSDESTMEGLLSNETIGFHAKLHSGHNNSYMICTRTELTDYSKVMVRFVLQKEFNIVHVSINGMTLRPKLKFVEDHYYEIEYKYDTKQLINVVCEIRQKEVLMVSLSNAFMEKVSNYTQTVLIPNKKMEMSFYLEPSAHDRLYCSTDYASGESAEQLTIRFTAVEFSYDPYSLDMELPSNGTVMELYNDFKLKVIFYEFQVGETLHLKCGVRYRTTPKLIVCVHLKDCDETDMNVISKTLHLTDKDDNTRIVCHFKDQLNKSGATEDYVMREIRVILRKRALFTTTINPPVTALPTTDREVDPASGVKSHNSYTLVYCLTAAGVSVIILLVILYWTVKKSCCCKKSSLEEKPPSRPHPDTVFYQNLLSVFRPINEREAMELESQYEEIAE